MDDVLHAVGVEHRQSLCMVALLAATATQFVRVGRLWTIEIEVAVTGAVIAAALSYSSGRP